MVETGRQKVNRACREQPEEGELWISLLHKHDPGCKDSEQGDQPGEKPKTIRSPPGQQGDQVRQPLNEFLPLDTVPASHIADSRSCKDPADSEHDPGKD